MWFYLYKEEFKCGFRYNITKSHQKYNLLKKYKDNFIVNIKQII